MNEHEFRTLLIKATEDRPAGIDLMSATPAASGRRPIRFPIAGRGWPAWALVPIATLGVAAAVGALVVVLPANQSSAEAHVDAAVANTSRQSYRIHSTSGAKTFDGAFDPGRGVGVITEATTKSETRFIGDLMYRREQPGSHWVVARRDQAVLEDAPTVIKLVKLAPMEPEAALERLRSATDVREERSISGQGWDGQRFTFALEDGGRSNAKGGGQEELVGATGSVDVDDEGRVRRLDVTFSDDGHRNVMDFTDFGAEVTVEAPPAAEVREEPVEKVVEKAHPKQKVQ
ncbi:hypothetical protein ABGB18_07865 [Nonomuraea sp. B12E4]|uniref:hypothetical protein n=1 Tax=Nonomuraea sp. B12E4 TaxID=3153564 RepID=UPI00325C6C06